MNSPSQLNYLEKDKQTIHQSEIIECNDLNLKRDVKGDHDKVSVSSQGPYKRTPLLQ